VSATKCSTWKSTFFPLPVGASAWRYPCAGVLPGPPCLHSYGSGNFLNKRGIMKIDLWTNDDMERCPWLTNPTPQEVVVARDWVRSEVSSGRKPQVRELAEAMKVRISVVTNLICCRVIFLRNGYLWCNPSPRSHIPLALRMDVLRDSVCLKCGSSYNLTVDHIVPVSKGGGDDRSNLQCLCRSCNSRKGAH
jgi:hypothetical protein